MFKFLFFLLLISLIPSYSTVLGTDDDSEKTDLIRTPEKKLVRNGKETSTPSPNKDGNAFTGFSLGDSQKAGLKNIYFKVCVSLGESSVSEVSSFIDQADEFILAFMYRFDSPALIKKLSEKYIPFGNKVPVPVILFLDSKQFGEIDASSRMRSVLPISLCKLGAKSFHHKVIITKKLGQQAFVIAGSANATAAADSGNSEDSVIIQSNNLANIMVTEYKKLLRMKTSNDAVKVFHENRLIDDFSNTDYLDTCIAKLQNQDALDESFKSESNVYQGDITHLAISTGFSGGNHRCFNVFKEVLSNQNNEILILFENYLTLEPNNEVWKDLLSKTPKLIVLDDSVETGKKTKLTNAESIKKLKTQKANRPVIFKPFTGGKFHHKLILQYLENGQHVFYTGSYHPSNAASANNSEMIIGIATRDVTQTYLLPILKQSGLYEIGQVWKFLGQYPIQFSCLDPLAKQTQIIKYKEMNRFIDRYQNYYHNLKEALSFSKPSTKYVQDINRKLLKEKIKDFKEKVTEEKLTVLKDIESETFAPSLKISVIDQLNEICSPFKVNESPAFEEYDNQSITSLKNQDFISMLEDIASWLQTESNKKTKKNDKENQGDGADNENSTRKKRAINGKASKRDENKDLKKTAKSAKARSKAFKDIFQSIGEFQHLSFLCEVLNARLGSVKQEELNFKFPTITTTNTQPLFQTNNGYMDRDDSDHDNSCMSDVESDSTNDSRSNSSSAHEPKSTSSQKKRKRTDSKANRYKKRKKRSSTDQGVKDEEYSEEDQKEHHEEFLDSNNNSHLNEGQTSTNRRLNFSSDDLDTGMELNEDHQIPSDEYQGDENQDQQY